MRRNYFILLMALIIIINPILSYGKDNLENPKVYTLNDLKEGLRSYLFSRL